MNLRRSAAAAALVVTATVLVTYMTSFDKDGDYTWWEWVIIIAATSVSVVVAIAMLRAQRELWEADAEKESERLRSVVGFRPEISSNFQSSENIVDPELLETLTDALKAAALAEQSEDITSLRKEISDVKEILQQRRESAAEADRRLAILIEVHSQALTQMKRSFLLSQSFATLGALILLIGVAMAVFRASSTGQQIASILASVIGLVINLTSALFFVQSNHARQHLERQSDQMREDAALGETIRQSEVIIEKVDDASQRDELRARVVNYVLGKGDRRESL